MKTIIAILLFAHSSCINSIHPFAGEAEVFYEPGLTGKWKCDTTLVQIDNFTSSPYRDTGIIYDAILRPRSETDWKLSKQAAKTYMISYQNKGIAYTLKGQLTRIGTDTFIQLLPYIIVNEEGLTGSTRYNKGYIIAKIAMKDKKVALSFPDGGRIKALILSGTAAVKHEYEPMFDVFVITASTAELRQSLRDFADDKTLFPSANVVTLESIR